MAHTAALADLIQQLHTDTTLQDKFKQDPAGTIEPFDISSHEHDAVATRDLDDLVAVGVAHSIEELPEVLRGTREEEPHSELPDHLRERIDRIRLDLHHLFDRHPHPGIPLQPEPGPVPGPTPLPRPGPDPAPGG